MWLARALGPKGRLVTLEVDEACVRCARKNLERASLLSRVDIRHGDARVTLEKMVAAGEGPFDLVFIDADKQSYPVYLDYAVQLTRPGSLILADNVIRDGKVAREDETDPLVKGVQEFNRKLAANPNLEGILGQPNGVRRERALAHQRRGRERPILRAALEVYFRLNLDIVKSRRQVQGAERERVGRDRILDQSDYLRQDAVRVEDDLRIAG